ncbi:MAG TPA: winged helix-turn-helix transcriptional regulator [Candidatus Nanoarchaeia archaeon]|nr:winged helix-turn-helix transcriptional regulator [Candidatus Nanoarchaeia archaeon]
MPSKLTLCKLNHPETNDLNSQLQWFSRSLGLFSTRDKEKSCFRIFIALIEAKKARRFLSSDELAEKSNLTRATIIHHLKNLEAHGLIKQENNRYALSYNTLSLLVKSLSSELTAILEDLEASAEELDKKLELKN